MIPHAAIYGSAALYDLAFSYRDCAAETEFLRNLYQARRGKVARNFLELAAGPARHALEMALAGLDVLALDIAPEMASYAGSRADSRGVKLPYLVADMIHFTASASFDLVACMLCSASYLLTDDDVRSHLASVRAALANDGMYVLELTHPAELSGPRKSNSTWTMHDDFGSLDVTWCGDPGSAIDGLWDAKVSLAYRPTDGSAPLLVEDEARQRGFTYAEFAGFAKEAGLEVEGTLGGFDETVTLDNPKATRMVMILRRS